MASGGSFPRSARWRGLRRRPRKDSTIRSSEHDACGVGFVARPEGPAEPQEIVEHGIQILENLTHRGATGADALAARRGRHPGADPACIPERSHRAAQAQAARPGPLRRRPDVLAAQPRAAHLFRSPVVARVVDAEGLKLFGWRDVP